MEEAITMTQKLIEQVIEHNSVQETDNHNRKLKDRRNTTNDNNNYRNTTVAMIITNSRIGSKKPSRLILPPTGILGIVPCVKMHPTSHRILHCQVSNLQQD
nr:hypothetical protein [Tanacetum cinerariifolium]